MGGCIVIELHSQFEHKQRSVGEGDAKGRVRGYVDRISPSVRVC